MRMRYSYNRYNKRKDFDFGDFTITQREIIASVSIIAVMILIGVLISGKISEHQMDKNEMYNKAVKIDSTELFQYGMDTNVGNAFVYGDLEVVDPVTYPEIGGEYMSIEKVKEEYTKHTRTVTYKDSNGKTKTKKETYWTWDKVDSEELNCSKVKFLGIEFNYGQIYDPYENQIEIIYDDSDNDIRYVYYGSGTKYTGTIFTELKNKTISSNTKFYNGMNIEETIEYVQAGGGEIIFWIFWIIFIGFVVFGFFYIDNKWLE